MTRQPAEFQGQPAGKEKDGGSSGASCPLSELTFARVVSALRRRPFVHADRQFDFAKFKIGAKQL